MKRKVDLVNGEIYHIFIRTIAGFTVFNSDDDYKRIIYLIKYYQIDNQIKFSDFLSQKYVQQIGFEKALEELRNDEPQSVEIISYCLMPTHIHLILKQVSENGISNYMMRVLHSYSNYFNFTHRRKGPLWESKFNNVLVDSDEYLLHLTRYFHLNPVSASLVDDPGNWKFSSYNEFISNNFTYPICRYDGILEINSKQYQNFVLDHRNYQKELSKIKHLLIDENL